MPEEHEQFVSKEDLEQTISELVRLVEAKAAAHRQALMLLVLHLQRDAGHDLAAGLRRTLDSVRQSIAGLSEKHYDLPSLVAEEVGFLIHTLDLRAAGFETGLESDAPPE